MSETQAVFESWAVVELMGHVRMAGRVTEEERFGSKMGRIDIPTKNVCDSCNGSGPIGGCDMCQSSGQVDDFFTQYFGGSSVYRVTPCSEEAARAVAARNQPEPVHQWELPKPALVAPAGVKGEGDSFDEEDDVCDDCGLAPDQCSCPSF